MSEEQAVHVDDETVVNDVDETIESTEETTTSDVEAKSEPKNDGIDDKQKTINKIAFEKREEKRRADAAEARVRELESANNAPATTETLVMPKEADYDFDTDKYNADMAKYLTQVASNSATQAVAANNKASEQAIANQKADELWNEFDRKVANSKIENFYEVTANLPAYNDDVRGVMMGLDNAPELIHYLTQHLDVADSISYSNNTDAAVKIGELSARLAANTVKNVISNTPEPIDTINQNGVVQKSEWDGVGGEATFE